VLVVIECSGATSWWALLLALVQQLGATGAQAGIRGAPPVGDPITGITIDDDPAAISPHARGSDLDGIQRLAEHRLDRVAQ
jgi:hypothetical protein